MGLMAFALIRVLSIGAGSAGRSKLFVVGSRELPEAFFLNALI